MGVEFEVKFRGTGAVIEALSQKIPGEETIYSMHTTYYDTREESLSARHWTLRRRMENDRSVCTLKTPAEGLGRREWEVEAETIEDGIEKLCKLGCPSALRDLTTQGVRPVCGARFTRLAKTVVLSDGTAELALDRGILYGGGREQPLCEIEVEKKTCSEASCLAFAKLLATKYSLTQEKKSKFRRALALYKGE